ncbi:hypothetical protein O181_045344 [Austropuccinia psidii MF-1]|uniref:Uncharacterized protein n=1 Tax=Austropuccinia psidii MF-1 TaxID=1389203 RepID=A0A9Q3HKA8_9BASI|nr:hypothetical protein [Austropuccinia psidii MF-1]
MYSDIKYNEQKARLGKVFGASRRRQCVVTRTKDPKSNTPIESDCRKGPPGSPSYNSRFAIISYVISNEGRSLVVVLSNAYDHIFVT